MEELSFAEKPSHESQPDPNPPILLENNEFVSFSPFSWDFYSQFFNVKTEDVLDRVKSALSPWDRKFLAIQGQPELYGAVWSTVTAVFGSMVFGNISAWIHHGNKWNLSLSNCITSFFLSLAYTFLSPFAYRWLSKSDTPPTTVSLMSLFGYTLLYMIPTAFCRLLVRRNSNYIISVVWGCIASFSVFVKLRAFYNDQSAEKDMSFMNFFVSLETLLIIMIVQYFLFL